jgi:MFS family permease
MANRWVALAIVFVTRTSMGVQFQSVASVAPLMVENLHLSWAQVGSLIGLYMLPGAALSVPGGLLGQRFGDRRMVIAGLSLMLAGGLVTAASGGFAVALIGRLVSGAGAVLMNIMLAKMIADWFTGREMVTAMAVMLTAWPVGLGLAASTLGGLAARTSWPTAIVLASATAALGLLLMAGLYRDAPARGVPGARAALGARDIGLSVSSGFAFGVFNASLLVVLAFAPAMLSAHGSTLGEAGFVVSLAIWVTILSIPAGGVLGDRYGRPHLLIVGGSLAAALLIALLPTLPTVAFGLILVGLVVGAPPGSLMSLLPRVLAPERLATGLGVFYMLFYLLIAASQSAAGLVRDVSGDPAMPIRFAAVMMTGTVLGLGAFRLAERGKGR